MTVQIDASAVIATLLNERGADVAYATMVDAAISVVNLCEVYTRLVQEGVTAGLVEQQVGRLDLRIVPFTAQHALQAARLRPLTIHLGLSLGDRACLAHAMVDRRPAVTADRDWAKLDLGVDIRLIR